MAALTGIAPMQSQALMGNIKIQGIHPATGASAATSPSESEPVASVFPAASKATIHPKRP